MSTATDLDPVAEQHRRAAACGVRAARRRITPNLFGISFGITGLAGAWGAGSRFFAVPEVVPDVLYIAAAAIWCATLGLYLDDVRRNGRARTELLDPTFAPFIGLVGIVPMLLGVALASHEREAGVAAFAVSMAFTVVLGGYLVGQWIVSDLTLEQWHPGYFLPTVAGGYLSAGACAVLGYRSLGVVMFGYATVSWLVLGSILLQRMFTQPRLPAPLLPTMAIQIAPPVVAGTAWFELNGGQVDTVALVVSGYAALMVAVQLRLVPMFRTAPFGPGWWAFSFSYAAVFIDAIHWLDAEDAPNGQVWTYLLLAGVTLAVLALVGRTANALRRGTFLPAPPATTLPKEPQA